jgi:uncharacterized membrane protein
MSDDNASTPNLGSPNDAAPANPDPPGGSKPTRGQFFGNLRANFLAGVVVAAPVGITIWLIWWFLSGPVAGIDTFVKRAIPEWGRFEAVLKAIPFLGVIVAIAAIVLLGAFTRNFVGRAFVKAGEEILDSVPVVRNLYRFFKNVFETALQKSRRSFKDVALIEYPSKGTWAIAFVIGDSAGEPRAALSDRIPDPVTVFVPTVPNPTSGFLLFVPRSAIKLLKMSVEDAAKMVFSLGLVVPDFQDPDEAVRQLEEAAAAASEKRPIFRLHLPGKDRTRTPGSDPAA